MPMNRQADRMAGLRGGALRRLAMLAGVMVTVAAMAAGSVARAVEQDPRSAAQTLRETTEDVLEVIENAQGYVDEDPERYYQAVHEVLDPVVDFRGFARGVMGEMLGGGAAGGAA